MSSNKANTNYYTLRNTVKLIKGGREYFTLLAELIQTASHSIHIQTYIFDDDETGTLVADALIKASQRNVAVYLIVDGYASRRLSINFIERMTDAGIQFKFFEPLFKSSHFYLGRRLHHKVVVVDGKHALVGGLNITNRYNDLPGHPAWLDYALYVKGEAAIQLFEICCELWNIESTSLALPADINEFLAQLPEEEYCSIRVSRNDWVKNRLQIWRNYLSFFNNANESIIIVCSYFLPGLELLKKIYKVVKKGVQVKIILTGVSDVRITKFAERYLYYWLLKNNIELYEYQPNVLHAKLAIIDQHWVTVGSYNINNISAKASMEINLDVRNKLFAQKVYKQIEEIIKLDCTGISMKSYIGNTGFFKRLRQKLAYHVINIILKLFTFYFKREFR